MFFYYKNVLAKSHISTTSTLNSTQLQLRNSLQMEERKDT